MGLDELRSDPLVALYEDRAYQIPGVKLLILSLHRYCPTWPIRLRFPAPPDAFREWLRRFPNVELVDERLPVAGSFNVKPSVLLDCLSSGASSCVWMDTDVLINGSLPFLQDQNARTVIVTQDPWEYADGSTHRAATWGLPPGRTLPGPLNSAVVRVTPAHTDMLLAWQQLLSKPEYLREQAKPVEARHGHLLGDQDVLSALLASEKYAHFPLLRLRHGIEILQHHGAGAYAPAQRWRNLRHGMPPILHAMGTTKPWRMPANPSILRSSRDYYERLYLELSPYVHFARQYAKQLEEPAEWLKVRTVAGRLGTMAALNHPALKGTIQAVLHDLARSHRR